jgi:multidrug resistance protein
MVGLTLVLPLLPYYATEFGANALVVGVLISAFSLAQLLCAPLWGGISDRHGRRPVILFGLATTSVAYVIFGFAHSVALLLISRVIQGIGGGTIGVVQAYVADASPPEERTKSLGWLTAVTSLGALVGPAFGSVLDQLAGRSAPGLAAAGLAIVTAAFALRYLPESQGARGEPAAPEPKVTGRDALRGVLARWREPASRLIWIYTIAIGAFYGTAGIFPLLLKARLGVTEHTIGYFFMYFGGMGVIVRAGILGRAVDRFGEARVARIGGGGDDADADRDGVRLPVRDGAALARGLGDEPRPLHGRAADVRRRVAGGVPDPRRLGDGPPGERGAVRHLGGAGIAHDPAHGSHAHLRAAGGRAPGGSVAAGRGPSSLSHVSTSATSTDTACCSTTRSVRSRRSSSSRR